VQDALRVPWLVFPPFSEEASLVPQCVVTHTDRMTIPCALRESVQGTPSMDRGVTLPLMAALLTALDQPLSCEPF